MGRLSALSGGAAPSRGRAPSRLAALGRAAALVVLVGVGCGEGEAVPPPPERRNEAVLANGPQPAATSATAPRPAAPRAPRKVCDKRPAADGKELADVAMGHVEAAGEPAVGERIPTGGAWTWVNLWAAWCGPCKEEMPVLKAWEGRLGGLVRLAFVSIDDDERLARRFLEGQPKGGVRRSYHLGDLAARKAWLEGVGLSDASKLPVHVLVDPEGAVRCVIQGAIEEQDFPAIEAFLKKR